MTPEQEDDLFYVCSLIEFIARQTKNKRRVIVEALKKEGFIKQLKDAGVNHCLSFEQVGEEIIFLIVEIESPSVKKLLFEYFAFDVRTTSF